MLRSSVRSAVLHASLRPCSVPCASSWLLALSLSVAMAAATAMEAMAGRPGATMPTAAAVTTGTTMIRKSGGHYGMWWPWLFAGTHSQRTAPPSPHTHTHTHTGSQIPVPLLRAHARTILAGHDPAHCVRGGGQTPVPRPPHHPSHKRQGAGRGAGRGPSPAALPARWPAAEFTVTPSWPRPTFARPTFARPRWLRRSEGAMQRGGQVAYACCC